MSREFVVKRSGRVDVDAAARQLIAAGYERVSGSARAVHLTARGGSPRVVLEADGAGMTFRFERGVHGPPLNEAELTQLVDRVAGGDPTSAPRRCPLCATVAAAGEVSCSLCGARLNS